MNTEEFEARIQRARNAVVMNPATRFLHRSYTEEHDMSNTLPIAHRGYAVEFDLAGEPPFYGKVVGIQDLVTAEAESIPDCMKQARAAIDDYIETCAELGVDPNTPEEHTAMNDLAMNETPNTGAVTHPEFTDEQRLQWRMDLVVRYADHTGMQLEEAAEAFKKAEAILTKSD